jgi:ribonuclease P protein component
MSDEADLSTEPAGASAPSRFPRAHGDPGRTQGAGEPPRQGPGEAERLAVPAAPAVTTPQTHIPTVAARKDFLAANSGRRAPTPGFVLLVRRRDDDAPMRAGYTVTKKIGNAVVRNRLKRRMRALVRQVLPDNGVPHADHILIGRSEGLTRRFDTLAADLMKALARCAG